MKGATRSTRPGRRKHWTERSEGSAQRDPDGRTCRGFQAVRGGGHGHCCGGVHAVGGGGPASAV